MGTFRSSRASGNEYLLHLWEIYFFTCIKKDTVIYEVKNQTNKHTHIIIFILKKTRIGINETFHSHTHTLDVDKKKHIHTNKYIEAKL